MTRFGTSVLALFNSNNKVTFVAIGTLDALSEGTFLWRADWMFGN